MYLYVFSCMPYPLKKPKYNCVHDLGVKCIVCYLYSIHNCMYPECIGMYQLETVTVLICIYVCIFL